MTVLQTARIASAIIALAASARAEDPMSKLRDNVRAIAMRSPSTGVSALPGTPDDDLAAMRPDGSWADQDYADTDRVAWKAQKHLPRLERIARAAYQKGRPHDDARDRILASLRFWLAADPKNANWWWNEIGVPRAIGTILLIVGDDVPGDVRANGVALMRRADWSKQTGANLLDETWIQVMRGCVAREPNVVEEALDRTWQELRIVGPGEEGIQPDGTFHQHGPLLYNQSYGGVLLNTANKFFMAVDKTTFRAPDAAFDALATLTLDGDRWMRRGDVWDWSVCGRAITRPGATRDKFDSTLDLLARHATGPRAAALRDAATRPADDAAPIGNRYFWRSDFLVHRRPAFHASVRMVSTRTANTDILTNGENKRSHHIADGATCLMRDGREYFDIYPIWNWARIPGTTAEEGGEMPLDKIRRFGGSDVAGGVTDGDVAACAMDLKVDGLSAKKAWFCFDDAIVCLGADIRCTSSREVVTTLNQAWMRESPAVDGKTIEPGDAIRRAAKTAWNDGVGYVSLDPSAGFDVRAGPQTGSWSAIGVGSGAPIAGNVFLATWTHGVAPSGGTYAYAIVPDAPIDVPTAAVNVIANAAACQAVERPGEIVMAIFRAAGSVDTSIGTVAVDRPCALLLRQAGANAVSVASLTNQADVVRVTLDHRGAARTLSIALPAAADAGRTVTRPLANP